MIFPTMSGMRVGYVNLNVWADFFSPGFFGFDSKKSIYLDPNVCDKMVAYVHKELNLDYSYGGWCEDRRRLWWGSYLDEKKTFLHLGVDLNVTPGVPVATDEEAMVRLIDNDTPEENGWGNRVILELVNHPVMLIYAHVGPTILCNVDERLKPGQVFAEVGDSTCNGGWFPHLHVQAVARSYYQLLLKDNLKDLDGYGKQQEINDLSKVFPDPIKFIRF